MKLNKEQQAIVEANLNLVPYAVNKYLSHVDLEYDDKISIGQIALCRAAVNFNPKLYNAFSTYAIKCIIRGVKREVLLFTRKKRGCGKYTESLDDYLNDDENSLGKYFKYESIIGYEPDFQNYVINKIACEPLWKLAPTFTILCKPGMTSRKYGESQGIKVATVNARKQAELKKLRLLFQKKNIYEDMRSS